MIWIEFCAVLVICLSLWSLILRAEQWFRVADFPRLQILAIGLGTLVGFLFMQTEWVLRSKFLFVGVIAAAAFQLKMILPYTPIWKKQVQQVRQGQLNTAQQLSVFVANVLTPNNKYHLLLQHIHELQLDIILMLESDQIWQNALEPVEQAYPYRVAVPLDNLYGMHLYSRLALIEPEIKFILSDEIPSIHASVTLRSGIHVQLYCLHSKPPSPTEAKDSTLRDAELLMVDDRIKDLDQSCIVMGDLNDVAWSRTTRLFQRISRLLDPRVGLYEYFSCGLLILTLVFRSYFS